MDVGEVSSGGVGAEAKEAFWKEHKCGGLEAHI